MTNKIALITGGSRGLGKNAAIALGKNKVGVILTYNKDKDSALAVKEEIERNGGSTEVLQLNVGQADNFPSFVEAAAKVLETKWQASALDILVNNAGIGLHASVAETTPAQFDELMNVHLKGTFFLTQALLPMINSGGRIINTSTGLTRFSLPGFGAYAAMKGAVEVLTRYLALELSAKDIAVNTIAPGAIETDFGGGVVRDNPDLNAFIASTTAMGRAGKPDDIGKAILAMALHDSQWMTGQRIEVSGGQNL